MNPRADAAPVKGGDLTCHLHEHAKRRRDGEHDDGKQLAHALEHREERKARDDDHVVEDRPEVAPEVVAMGVEHAREHRGEPVEEDLEREEAEEEHRRVHAVGVPAHERLRPDERRGEDGGRKGEDAEEEQEDPEEVANVLLRAALAALPAHVHVDREKRRDEHSAHHEVVEHGGQVLGNLVGGGEKRDAERDAHNPGADEPGDAAHDDESRHQTRGATNALVVAGGGEVIVVLGGRRVLW